MECHKNRSIFRVLLGVGECLTGLRVPEGLFRNFRVF